MNITYISQIFFRVRILKIIVIGLQFRQISIILSKYRYLCTMYSHLVNYRYDLSVYYVLTFGQLQLYSIYVLWIFNLCTALYTFSAHVTSAYSPWFIYKMVHPDVIWSELGKIDLSKGGRKKVLFWSSNKNFPPKSGH